MKVGPYHSHKMHIVVTLNVNALIEIHVLYCTCVLIIIYYHLVIFGADLYPVDSIAIYCHLY